MGRPYARSSTPVFIPFFVRCVLTDARVRLVATEVGMTPVHVAEDVVDVVLDRDGASAVHWDDVAVGLGRQREHLADPEAKLRSAQLGVSWVVKNVPDVVKHGLREEGFLAFPKAERVEVVLFNPRILFARR